jgi:hypothetical protein
MRGADPDEVEQPTRFEMMITLKTAKELDIDIRPAARPRRRGHRIGLLFWCGAYVASWHETVVPTAPSNV